MTKLLIGVDLGTTLAKCAIYDEEGILVAEASREMSIDYPAPGHAEQDANQFYEVTCSLIKQCLRSPKVDKKNIQAISIDSQMGGIMTIDKDYNPVTYYDTPLDIRSAAENKYMHDNYGELILKKNGSLSTFGNKIIYWKKNPEYTKIYKFIQPSAFVSGKLAGLSGDMAYIDESFICFSGISDLERSSWSPELCDYLEVEQSKLPLIVKSGEVIGQITKKASQDCGLSEGVTICAGCGDQAAGFLGAGIFNAGQMVDSSGTACILGAAVEKYCYDLKNKTLACMKSALGDNYYLLSVVLGGRTHKWFVDEFYQEEIKALDKNANIYNYLDKLAEKIKPGSGGLISINYLQGRFFPPDSNTRGLFIGHTWAHTKMHFYRAILESIGYDHYLTKEIIKELIPGQDFKNVTAIGSGNKSSLWMQIKADILQQPYQSLFRSDLATLGSAIIAGYASGTYKDINKVIQNIVKVKDTIYPKEGEDKKYLGYVEIYKNLFAVLKDTYEKISETS